MILSSPITLLLRQAWRRNSSRVVQTSCDIDRPRTQSSNNVIFIQNKAKEEEQSVQESQETQRHFNRAFVHATTTNGAAYTVSSLQETSNQNEGTIHHLLQRLSEMDSHTVTAEVVDWKDKYEQMVQSCEELMKNIGDLAEKNEQLLVKRQQLEVNKKRLNDMLVDKINDLADKKEKLEYELVSSKASREALRMQNTATTVTNSSCFSGDVYAQLDQFEHSLDRELEDFHQLAYS